MRLLFVVQRYGSEVAGGAEAACRELAWRLADRGHDVHVLTSCAKSYVDWANAYPEGDSDINGVRVHRLPVARPREDRFFGPMNGRAVWGTKPNPLFVQAEWMRFQGPDLPGLVPWLSKEAGGYDVVIFVTYLYATTWAGLPVASGMGPTILLPAAHDEPPFWLPLFDLLLRMPTAFAFLTEEEEALVSRRTRVVRPSSIVGLGVDLDASGDGSRFRAAHGVGERPYLLYVGRLDPGKGSDELYDYFTTYKARHPGDLALVVVGEPVKPLAPHPDVITTGFVDEQVKVDAIAGCTALVMPSYFESFSLVLAEAWAQSKPALVNGRCDVLVGQAQRSGGAVPYEGFAEFEAAVDLLLDHPELQVDLGFRGRRYVEHRYHWDTVLDHMEHLCRTAIHLHRQVIPSVATVSLSTD
ncbi:MAG: glycosyltransferase family 4 protein [Acidimicrobiales bacterium]